MLQLKQINLRSLREGDKIRDQLINTRSFVNYHAAGNSLKLLPPDVTDAPNSIPGVCLSVIRPSVS